MKEIELVGKRVNLKATNIKKLKIITTLYEDEVLELNERKKTDYIINKAIESFYSSEEVKKLLDL